MEDERIIEDLSWVENLEDIDHDICNVAERAIREIIRLRERVENLEADLDAIEHGL